jgi:hypothetical protein
MFDILLYIAAILFVLALRGSSNPQPPMTPVPAVTHIPEPPSPQSEDVWNEPTTTASFACPITNLQVVPQLLLTAAKPDYNNMTVKVLKQHAQAAKLSGYSKMKRSALIAALTAL